MAKVELIDKRFLWGSVVCAIYQVETAKAGLAYMRVDRSNYCNGERAVVVVDATRFLARWRAALRVEPVALGEEADWRADYKFEDAAKGFAHGIENPVPLADVGLIPSAGAPEQISVGFTNGITRTLWLLANGASAFPIECRMSSAATMHAMVGVPSHPIVTVESLLDTATCARIESGEATAPTLEHTR